VFAPLASYPFIKELIGIDVSRNSEVHHWDRILRSETQSNIEVTNVIAKGQCKGSTATRPVCSDRLERQDDQTMGRYWSMHPDSGTYMVNALLED